MQLNIDELQEFAEIWKLEFGETISIEEARAELSRLLELLTLLNRPLPEERAGSLNSKTSSK
jgi:hypothetical protein